MDSMYSMFDLIILVCGIYVLYTWYLMKFKNEIKESLLLPKDVSVKKCKDLSAYIKEMSPEVLIYGLMVVLCGAAGILEDNYHVLGWGYLVMIAVFVAVTVWFILMARKAVKKYW